MDLKAENERTEVIAFWDKRADFYDKYRPDYPEELVAVVINKADLIAGSKVLEIGAGSGKATVQFADFGFEMLCIEPASDSAKKGAEKLRDKNIEFIVSTFEDYAAPPEYFDAIIAGQAFHWIIKEIGYRISKQTGFEKCANTLKKGGYLAPFWHLNLFRRDVDLDRELWAMINKYSGWVSCMLEEDYPKRMENITANITGSGLFSKPEIMHFYKEINFTADEYYNYMLTGSNVEKQCHEELTQLAEKYNGIKRRFTYELYITQKI